MDLLGHFLKAMPAFRGRGRLRQYWLKRRRHNVRRRRTLPGGASIACDLRVPYEAMVWLEEEEQADLEVLRMLLEPGHAFVDVGANIGLWTLVGASAVNRSGGVLAFEPNPATFRKLSENVRASGRETVRLFNAACGEKNGELPFCCEPEHNVSHVASVADAQTVQVPVVTLDSVLGDTVVHGLKVDVEGYEMSVLKGAQAALQKWRPWLCIEFNTALAGTSRLGDWDVHRYLRDLHYSCFLFCQAAQPESGARLSNDWIARGYCNLFYWHP